MIAAGDTMIVKPSQLTPLTTIHLVKLLEDGGNRIEELRVGGETQSVTVQPKAPVPPYEIQPNDLARSRPSDSRDGLAERKQRVWNVLSF